VNAPFSSTLLPSARPIPDHPRSGSAPVGTFRMAVDALQHISGLTRGVRRNLINDLSRCAAAISTQGLEAQVDVTAVAEWIGRMSPAQLNFKHPGSFSAFRSNLWRALKLTGHWYRRAATPRQTCPSHGPPFRPRSKTLLCATSSAASCMWHRGSAGHRSKSPRRSSTNSDRSWRRPASRVKPDKRSAKPSLHGISRSRLSPAGHVDASTAAFVGIAAIS
jgi:hypothetical protein